MVLENGEVVQGSLARIEPDGKVTRMWEAIETYMEREQPLIIIAGSDYGQGSSRDWAAKGVRLAGVEVIVAEGFERIHRTNLIGMGVLPLEFKPGDNRHSCGIDGSETFDVQGEPAPGVELTLVINRSNGERVEVPVTCRLDTAEEVSIYSAGGVLQRFAEDFLESSASMLMRNRPVKQNLLDVIPEVAQQLSGILQQMPRCCRKIPACAGDDT
jgi:aconitate hydratase